MGSLITNGSNTFSYDAAGRMVAASSGGSSGTYQVNAEGLRVHKWCHDNPWKPNGETMNLSRSTKFALISMLVFDIQLLAHCLINGWHGNGFVVAVKHNQWLTFFYAVIAIGLAKYLVRNKH